MYTKVVITRYAHVTRVKENHQGTRGALGYVFVGAVVRETTRHEMKNSRATNHAWCDARVGVFLFVYISSLLEFPFLPRGSYVPLRSTFFLIHRIRSHLKVLVTTLAHAPRAKKTKKKSRYVSRVLAPPPPPLVLALARRLQSGLGRLRDQVRVGAEDGGANLRLVALERHVEPVIEGVVADDLSV